MLVFKKSFELYNSIEDVNIFEKRIISNTILYFENNRWQSHVSDTKSYLFKKLVDNETQGWDTILRSYFQLNYFSLSFTTNVNEIDIRFSTSLFKPLVLNSLFFIIPLIVFNIFGYISIIYFFIFLFLIIIIVYISIFIRIQSIYLMYKRMILNAFQ